MAERMLELEVARWPEDAEVNPGLALRLVAHGVLAQVRDRIQPTAEPTIEGVAGVSAMRFPRVDETSEEYVADVIVPAVRELVANLPPCITKFKLPASQPQAVYAVLETLRLDQLAFAIRLEVLVRDETASIVLGFEGRRELP